MDSASCCSLASNMEPSDIVVVVVVVVVAVAAVAGASFDPS